MQGRPLFESSSIFGLVPCLQSVGISSCLPLCCPSISFSVGLCSFSQKPLELAILHRCGCVLASSSVQTTLLFCFPAGFTWASFLMSSFLIWSNLAFPYRQLLTNLKWSYNDIASPDLRSTQLTVIRDLSKALPVTEHFYENLAQMVIHICLNARKTLHHTRQFRIEEFQVLYHSQCHIQDAKYSRYFNKHCI